MGGDTTEVPRDTTVYRPVLLVLGNTVHCTYKAGLLVRVFLLVPRDTVDRADLWDISGGPQGGGGGEGEAVDQ